MPARRFFRNSISIFVRLAAVWQEESLHSRRVGSHADVQMRKLPEHLAILGVQSLDKRRVVELSLPVGFDQIAQRVQALQDGLAALLRELLPARKQYLADVTLLFGSHLLPHTLPLAQFLLLPGSQAIPGFEALADLRLLFRRQTQKALVVPQELFLPPRRHVLQFLDGFRRKIIGIPAGKRVRQPGPHLRMRSGGTRPVALLLRSRIAPLRVRRAAHESRRKERSQSSFEL